MSFCFLGVDLGGEENTWALALDRATLQPLEALSFLKGRPVSLSEVREFAEGNIVLAAALDAPLAFSLEDQKGLRPADRKLREILRETGGDPGWVMSYSALMGLPLRALLLAEALSPMVGTILETHPRAGLFLSLPGLREEVRKYKVRKLSQEEKRQSCRILWRALGKMAADLRKKCAPASPKDPPFPEPPEPSDGLVDALACALTAATYHLFPEGLCFLPPSSRGFGPFVVLFKVPKLSPPPGEG
ncbi:DUF429 domain-containing protein [Thermosulfurimonas marina]|uniref:DUF429 domain-containing protein n=1 Tax=Thermosulfurimonas marina TaxID=2047767 RepID=A0A6H1WQD0_9BACT|nr:DUF429 domain-containing protein [Thermosulfurimonas marina]QJA05425.1 DUF429 domain-containing protein [Thermosulfurimonas marina]